MNKLVKALNILVPCGAVVLVVLQVIVSNELATLNASVGRLDVEIAQARDTHEILSTQVASASSLMVLRDKALELGFHEPTSRQVISLTPEVPVAFGGSPDHSATDLLR